jgi:hypothetical protein
MPSTAAAQSARNADANFSARIQGRCVCTCAFAVVCAANTNHPTLDAPTHT